MAVGFGDILTLYDVEESSETPWSTLHKLAQENKPCGQRRRFHKEAIDPWMKAGARKVLR